MSKKQPEKTEHQRFLKVKRTDVRLSNYALYSEKKLKIRKR